MIIGDTSAWYAFIVENDEFHATSVEFLKTKPKIITTNIVFEECLTLLHHRIGKDSALAASKAIPGLSWKRIRYITEEEDREILEFYENTNKQIDYVDASVAWLSKQMESPVFTFDSHFEKLGIETLPDKN